MARCLIISYRAVKRQVISAVAGGVYGHSSPMRKTGLKGEQWNLLRRERIPSETLGGDGRKLASGACKQGLP